MSLSQEFFYSAEASAEVAAATIKILTVDRASALRAGLLRVMAQQADFEIVGEIETVAEAELRASKLEPDLIIVEPDLPGSEGVSVISKLRIAYPRSRIVVHSHVDTARLIRAALAAGASGYIVKFGSTSDFIAGLRVILEGGRHLCAVAAKRLRHVRRAEPQSEAGASRGISSREREVLTMIAGGLCNKRIATTLHLSTKTVEKHRANLMRKLQLRNVAGITQFAIQNGFVKFCSDRAAEASDVSVRRVPTPSVEQAEARSPQALVAGRTATDCNCRQRHRPERRAAGLYERPCNPDQFEMFNEPAAVFKIPLDRHARSG